MMRKQERIIKMCVVSFNINPQADYPFVFIGNRDEFYQRESQPIHQWPDVPHIYAGRDTEQCGTWLGVTPGGYFATILNDPNRPQGIVDQPQSRGNLVRNFLEKEADLDEYLTELRRQRHNYQGFFLIFGNFDRMYFYSNVQDRVVVLSQGLHVFSNTEDDMSNFRTYQAKRILLEHLNSAASTGFNHETCLLDFHNTERHPNFKTHPKRFSYQRAYQASSLFIEDDRFGTVGTTMITVDQHGQVQMTERRYTPQGVKDQQHLSFQTTIRKV